MYMYMHIWRIHRIITLQTNVAHGGLTVYMYAPGGSIAWRPGEQVGRALRRATCDMRLAS